MLNLMNHPDEQEAPKRLAPPCYGCSYLCASPFECTHPGGLMVRWDPIRNHTYRLPSVDLCRTSDTGMCQFYEPDEERGAEYAYLKRKIQKEHTKKVTKIDEVLDKINDDDVSVEDFIDQLTDLSEELDLEDGGIDDTGTT